MEATFHPYETPQTFEDTTLILPAASFGNVGQLAVDLIVNSWNLPAVGHILEGSLLPCFGGPAYEFEAKPSTELQIFGRNDLFVLQQRSPAALGREQAFAENIAKWIGQANFKQVILLGSIDAAMRTESQLEGSQLRFRSNDTALTEACQNLGISKLEARDEVETAWEDMLLPPWSLWSALQQQISRSLLLVSFAGEGLGNAPEAAILASLAQAALERCVDSIEPIKEWKEPISWSHLFGNSIVEEIY